MITTARLELRPPAEDDLPWVLQHMNTPGVMRHLGGVRSATRVAAELEDSVAAFAKAGYGRWTVWLRDDDRRIGRTGLFVVATDAAPATLRGQVEIGWTLAEDCWGQGFATEAARAVIDYGFGTLGHSAIHAQTSDSNAASTRMMTRLGFVRLPEWGYIDPDYPAADNPTTVYRLARRAWEAGQ